MSTVTSFRSDRLATLYFFRPLRRCVPLRGSVRIPILMYHSISDDRKDGVHPYYVTETSTKTFESHMRILRESGYESVTVHDLVSLIDSASPTREKTVVITFDDGYRDFYTHAFPILHKYGFRATVYLPTAYIHKYTRAFKNKPCLTWSEARELHEAGTSFGSHTVNHLQLRLSSPVELESELRISKGTIENELGAQIDSFSYPYAFPEDDSTFCHRLRDVLTMCGYQNGVTTVIGSSHSFKERFFLKRLPANSCDDPSLFRAKLEGSYDWLRLAQYFYKKFAKPRHRAAEFETA